MGLLDNLLNFKKQKAKGLLGIHFKKDGVAFAYTEKPATQGQIDLCDFIECEESERFKVIKQFIKKHKLGRDLDINLILPPPDYQTLTVDAPNIDASEYHQAAKWLVKDLLDYPVTEAAIDLIPLPAGPQTKLYLICARQSLVRQYIKQFNSLHTQLMSMETVELALRNLLLLKGADDCMLMFKTDYFTGVIVFKNKTIYLVRSIRADLDEMSHTKLVTEVKRTLDYYQNQTQQDLPKSIYITPNLEVYQNLHKHLQDNFQLPIETLRPADFVSMPEMDSDKAIKVVAAVGATQSLAILQLLPEED